MPCLVHHKIGKLDPIVIDEGGKKELRSGSQTESFKALRNKQLTILNAPTGWGKSFVTLSIVTWKLLKNPKLRCIIVVPQTVISKGFLEDIRFKVRGQWVNWSVGHNLCHVRANQRVEALGRFLRRRRQETLSDRVLVCTHQTLSAAYQKLPTHVFKNLVLWIDEAHHVMNGEVEDGSTRSNTMGKVVLQCIKNGCDVGLATATFMRGDLRHILCEDAGFTAHKVPYDVYFKESPPVESFSIDLLCGDKDKSLRSILKTKQKTIIYLPKRNSHFASCKLKERNAIFKILARGGKITKGSIVTQCGTQRVIDLIDTKGRKARQQYIMDNDDIDVIIALETCKEGFDWPAAERSIMIGERKSIPEMVQMVGRLFRRYEGKKHASIYQVMPGVKHGKKFKEHRNRIWTSIFSSMLLEDVLIPLKFCKPLTETVSNSGAAQSLWRDFLVAIKGLDYKASLDRMASVLEGRVPEADWEARWKSLWEQLWKLIYSIRGLQMDVDFSVLKKMDVIDELLLISSDLCGVKTFEELRNAIGRSRKTGSEFEALLSELTKDGKVLPCYIELRAKYGHGFVQWWGRNRHRFPEIIQENLNTSPGSEHQALLLKLTKGGKSLPCNKDLVAKHGRSFVCWWHKNKHRFPEIKQESLTAHFKTGSEHQALLLKLTKGGKTLPCCKDLAAKYGQGFEQWWRKNKYRFPEIKQARLISPRKTGSEHEALLLKLTKGGKSLPCNRDLIAKHGSGFASWWHKNKHRFPKIKRGSLRTYKTGSEHEALLLKLTKGGKSLPCHTDLVAKHGKPVESWWQKNKCRFPEIKQQHLKGYKKAGAHEALLLKLTADGNTLPCIRDLTANYGYGFGQWWYKNKHRFLEITQENLTTLKGDKHKALLLKLTVGGKTLPCGRDLAAKYGQGFETWWRANKHRFPEIKQGRLTAHCKTGSEHQALLLKLTKGGKSLPCNRDLIAKHGSGFRCWWHRDKHRFPEIKQARLISPRKTGSEHEALLLKLTKGGKSLPCYTDLMVKHGSGFCRWWQENKHRFPNIKQAKYNK